MRPLQRVGPTFARLLPPGTRRSFRGGEAGPAPAVSGQRPRRWANRVLGRRSTGGRPPGRRWRPMSQAPSAGPRSDVRLHEGRREAVANAPRRAPLPLGHMPAPRTLPMAGARLRFAEARSALMPGGGLHAEPPQTGRWPRSNRHPHRGPTECGARHIFYYDDGDHRGAGWSSVVVAVDHCSADLPAKSGFGSMDARSEGVAVRALRLGAFATHVRPRGRSPNQLRPACGRPIYCEWFPPTWRILCGSFAP